MTFNPHNRHLHVCQYIPVYRMEGIQRRRNCSNETTQDETTKIITKENKTKRKKRKLIFNPL